MTAIEDVRWMHLALGLGARGMGRVWPNPAVGCVIVADGHVVGRGWTAPGGRPHAETRALAQAGDAARGATAYVSLEPCAHHGETPPCAQALIGAGIARVVAAIEDPDPRVAGGGFGQLRAAGVRVETGLLASEAARDHRGFLSRVTRGRPMVTLKLATSLDGRIATAAGESRWITGPEARRAVHAMRARHDAVMIGAGTALADDPLLTVRGLGIAHQPLRVVCDSQLRLDPGSALGRSAGEVPLWLCHGAGATPEARAAWEHSCARPIPCATRDDGRLAMDDVLLRLGAAGLTRVFCEGGGTLAASLLAGGLVDELVVFHAGLVLGAGGLPAIGTLPDASLADIARFRLRESRAIGPDTLQVWERP